MTQPLVGKQILIVEDEPVFRSLLDSWFSSLGATTALAGDGVDALELMGRFTPDLMICDIAMPRMNGLKLVENLRNRGDQTPILVISATENMADIAKALRLGVEDVLLKPVKDSTACGKPYSLAYTLICLTRGLKKKSACFVTGMQW